MDSTEHDVSCGEGNAKDFHDNPSTGQHEEEDRSRAVAGDRASPGKIFVGGLARETTSAQFVNHFEKYGAITDSVIMKDRKTGHPRGFGFITYADPSAVDQVIQDNHTINGKQVEIKRTIPKGAIGARDFKTKKIFVGGIPTAVEEDELREFFSAFGEVKEHQIMRDHSTNRSRGFGFVTFTTEEAVDEILTKGNKIEFAGSMVEIKKAEPKKPNGPPPPSKRFDSRFGYSGGFGDTYGAYGGDGFGAEAYRRPGAYGSRAGAYSAYGMGDLGAYGGYGGGAAGPYKADASYGGYSGRYSGASSFSRGGYDMAGGYGGPGEGYGGYGGSIVGGGGYGGGYGSALGGGYGGSSSSSSLYGSSRGGYGGTGGSRYHPYAR